MSAPKRRPANAKIGRTARSGVPSERRVLTKSAAILTEEVDVVHEFTDADSRKIRGKPLRGKTTSK